MQSDDDSGLGNLDAQLACKEKESKEFLAAKVHQLEGLLKRAQEECSSLRERYQQLWEDFQFNLAILDERDRELERYDVLTARAVKHHSSTATQIQTQAEEYDRMKWDLECRIRELEKELSLQNQVTTAALNAEVTRQQHAFNLNMDEMRAVMLSQDLQVKLLSRQTEEQCQAQLQIQTLLECKEQELKDLKTARNHRIQELEDELRWKESQWKEKEEKYIKKYEDIIRALKEYDAQMEARCQAFTDQLQTADRCILKLHKSMEVLSVQVQGLQKDQKGALQQKDATIQRLCKDLEATQTGWDKYMAQVSSEMVVKDTEIIMLQEKETKLRTERERSQGEMERYRQQLSAGLQREQVLEQTRVQVELDWQRRCEDQKVEICLANELLTKDLIQARDQAEAELKRKDQELQDMAASMHSGNTKKDQAIQVAPTAPEEVGRLQEQNHILRAVVNQLRKDMEGLSRLRPEPPAQPQGCCPQPGRPGPSGPPAQSADSSLSPADVLDPEKHANSLALTKQEVRGHITGQKAGPREERVCLRQQLAVGLRPSDGGSEHEQAAKSSRRLLHRRLKQAALCIARLSRDKQQLIEMGNQLRGQILTTGPQGHFPPRDSSPEGLGHRHDHLTALEQLQYQLTTQELQLNLRCKTSCALPQVLPGTNSKWSQDTSRPECSKKHKENAPPLSQSRSCWDEEPRPPSESSLQSLQQLWEMIDYGLSTSTEGGEGERSRRDAAESGGAGVQMMVSGVCAPIQSQPAAVVRQRRTRSAPSNTTRISRPAHPGRIGRIRNYNVTD